MREAFLGIDLGTSSVKAVLVDGLGVEVASSQVVYPINRPTSLWAEQDPEAWWAAASDAIRTALATPDVKVLGVGVTGQMHGLVMLDDNDAPVRPAIIWSDCRTTEELTYWRSVISEQRVEQITGFPISLGMLGISLTWVRDNEQQNYARTRTVISPKDYLRLRLTGEKATEPTDAGGTLLYDIRKGAMSSEILQAVGIRDDLFAPVIPSLSIAGEVTADASARTDLMRGTPVAAGGGDQAMAAIALGLDDSTRAAVAISSGGTVFKRTARPLDHSLGLHVMPDAVDGKWLAMGVVLSAGLGVNWLASRLFGSDSSPERITALMTAAEQVPAGSNGLLFLPHLGGTRTPSVDPQARGSLIGLGFDHGSEHITRAMVEGVCIALRQSITSMSNADEPVRELVVSGGLARFRLWRQTLSDVTGLPVKVSSDLEHSALGAAHAAAGVVDRRIELDVSTRVTMTHTPDEVSASRYTELFDEVRSVEKALEQRKESHQ
jgi:xylulokinase